MRTGCRNEPKLRTWQGALVVVLVFSAAVVIAQAVILDYEFIGPGTQKPHFVNALKQWRLFGGRKITKQDKQRFQRACA